MVDTKTTADAASKVSGTRRQFTNRWISALEGYHGEIWDLELGIDPGTRRPVAPEAVAGLRSAAAAKLVSEWQAAIDDNWRSAYKSGRAMWGPVPPDPSLSQLAAWSLREQKRRAFGFAMDIARGLTMEPKRMSEGLRSSLYSQAIEGAYQLGAIDASPPGELITWRLGACKHCRICPLIAAGSPYTKDTLPTFPRSGQTPCGGNCRCTLIFTQAKGVQRQEPSPEEVELGHGLRVRNEGPLPKPPPGFRLAEGRELTVLRDLEFRGNFALRRANAARLVGDLAEQSRWLAIRSEITGAKLSFTDPRKIWHPPTFSAGEVLRGVDIKAGDISWLTHLRGIDGLTVHRAHIAAVEQVVKAAEKQMRVFVKDLPPNAPAVPDLEALIRAAGAPGVAFGEPFKDSYRHHHPPELFRLTAAKKEVHDPKEHVVVNVIGSTLVLTLESVLAAMRLLKQTERNVAIGPVDENWIDLASFVGLWIEGPASDVWALVKDIDREVGGRGVEAMTWQVV